jgi:hypothetical protein
MRLVGTTRKIGLVVLAGGIAVLSLTTTLTVGSAHAATLASVSQQGGGADQFAGRLAHIDELVQSGDCSAARTEIRSLLSENPENMFGSDATLAQVREFQNRLDDTLYRASKAC